MADAVIVTGDSVSMCSEAAATVGPMWIYAPKKLTIHKHGILHQQLYDAGIAKPFDGSGGTVFESWQHDSLNAAFDIADEIKKRLGIF